MSTFCIFRNEKLRDFLSESCGLAVEHLADDCKVVGSIPVNARWKWCQSHARIDFCTQFWFFIENKKNTGSQMGHTKKKLKKEIFQFLFVCTAN
jgi:hypothetical protein